jgi:hypothetical protein
VVDTSSQKEVKRISQFILRTGSLTRLIQPPQKAARLISVVGVKDQELSQLKLYLAAIILFSISFPTLSLAGMYCEYLEIDKSEIESFKENPDLIPKKIVKSPQDMHLDLHKSWHGIHYLLTKQLWESGNEFDLVIIGGIEIGNDINYGPARIHSPNAVKKIASLLNKVSEDTLKTNYDPMRMDKLGIYPNIWVRDGKQGLSELLIAFRKLKDFFNSCATRSNAVITIIW